MTKKFKFFEEDPELYEKGFAYRKINEQVNFLDKIFSKNKSKNILDIACGHTPQGRKLAKKGYKVSGIDLSSSLLNLAKKRAKEEGVELKLYKKDMRNFKLGKFDGAYILFSSILHLYKEKDLVSHFKSVSNNLKEDGLYIIDLSSLPFDSPYKKTSFNIKQGDIVTKMTYNPIDKSKLTANFTSVSYFKGKKVNVDSFTVLMFLSLTRLRRFAKKTGFKVIELYSNFNFNKKLNSKKPEYIAILRKRNEK
jgi:2-polyprenyl-3-methyl-5-hydroxy-6-metoxy-1,4-benzoquinol methylase